METKILAGCVETLLAATNGLLKERSNMCRWNGKVRSMDPGIAGCFAMANSDIGLACNVSFPFRMRCR